MPAVFDQLKLGSCTANAVCAVDQFDISLDRQLAGQGNAHRRSRLDCYYGERSLEGELGQGDTGAYGRDAFKFAQQSGLLLEQVWPYDITTYNGPPPAGRRHKLTKPYAVVQQDVAHMKAVLSNKQMIAFGFEVYSYFETSQMDAQAILDMPRTGESRLGGHEPALVGYLAGYPNYAIARNSWSASWGDAGYFLISWAYLCSDLVSDLRTIVRATS